jgi:hypothetical protein
MKLCGMLSVLAIVMSASTSYSQQLDAQVPGDHFSLEGALELFKKSESPEDFERLLNLPDSKVNNLDLNGDGYIDYIRVFDRYEGNVHAFILQAVVSDQESQDIAVIELEKLANGKAVLQIIGDADVYGVETIIEPTTEVRTYAGTTTSSSVVNVWTWPSVRYVYSPYYSSWYSPWGWHAYPIWWHTWRPVSYVHYHPVYVTYRPYYSYCHTRRIVHAHHIYRPYRATSVFVYNRHRDQIDHYRSDHRDGYRSNRSDDDRRSYADGHRSFDRNTEQLNRRTSSDLTRSSSQRQVESVRSERSGETSNFSRSNFTKKDFDKSDYERSNKTVETGSSSQRSSSYSGTRSAPREANRNPVMTRTSDNRPSSSRQSPARAERSSVENQRRTRDVQKTRTTSREHGSSVGSAQRSTHKSSQPSRSSGVKTNTRSQSGNGRGTR